MSSIRFIQYGLGPIGLGIVELALARGHRIVGAFDIDPQKVGRPLSALIPSAPSAIRVERPDRSAVITLDLIMAAGAAPPRDAVAVDGDPPLQVEIPGGVLGDEATCAIVVNARSRGCWAPHLGCVWRPSFPSARPDPVVDRAPHLLSNAISTWRIEHGHRRRDHQNPGRARVTQRTCAL